MAPDERLAEVAADHERAKAVIRPFLIELTGGCYVSNLWLDHTVDALIAHLAKANLLVVDIKHVKED